MNLILDPLSHAPHLKYLIPDSLYYTQPNTNPYPAGHYKYDLFENKFKFNLNRENQIISTTNLFKNLFIVFPILSTEKTHQGDGSVAWVKLYKFLYDKFINKISGKVIIFDNHGGDYSPDKYLLKFGFKYDIIFKRVYSKRNQSNYTSNTYAYPFIMDTNNDPIYQLCNFSLIEPNKKVNKILWSGTLHKYNEVWDDNNNNEHCDREYILNTILQKDKNIVDIINIPYSSYLKTMSNYKYTLDLRGTSRLNKRLYEILSTDTLLLAEKIDVIWPFDEGDNFSEECFFSNATELYNNYLKFENNNELYKKCLENQKYIVNKYFKNKWLWEYIQTIINNNY